MQGLSPSGFSILIHGIISFPDSVDTSEMLQTVASRSQHCLHFLYSDAQLLEVHTETPQNL